MKIAVRFPGVASAIAAVALATLPAQARSQDCDRACLEGWLDSYLDALSKHDPSAVELADDVRFTANGQLLAIGDGVWRTFQARGNFEVTVVDVPAQQIAAILTFVEDGPTPAGTGAALAVRLKVEDGRITEIEQREEHSAETFRLMEANGVRPSLTAVLPPEQRLTRAELIATVNGYYSGIQRNDGRGTYPLAEDCHRITSGRIATNNPTPPGETRPDPRTASGPSTQWSCREQFQSGLLHFVSRVRDRRVVAVDEERGLAFALSYFDHFAGDTRTFQTPDGRTVSVGPTYPFTWGISQVFKIEDALIQDIEGLEIEVPFGMTSGWSSWDDAMSDKIFNETGN
jgi:hypothetical protein